MNLTDIFLKVLVNNIDDSTLAKLKEVAFDIQMGNRDSLESLIGTRVELVAEHYCRTVEQVQEYVTSYALNNVDCQATFDEAMSKDKDGSGFYLRFPIDAEIWRIDMFSLKPIVTHYIKNTRSQFLEFKTVDEISKKVNEAKFTKIVYLINDAPTDKEVSDVIQ